MKASTRTSNQITIMYARKRQKLSAPDPFPSQSLISAKLEEEEPICTSEYAGPRSCSTHHTYPFPIADFRSPGTLVAGIVEASAGKPIKKGDLDLLYFQPFVKAPAARALYTHLLEELPWYKVIYFARGMSINTPRYTTVFGLDATAVFEPPLPPPSEKKFPMKRLTNADEDGGVQEGCVHIPVAGTNVLSANAKHPVPMTLYQKPPRPIPRCLQELKGFVEKSTGETYNFVLCNFYADGSHSISPHSDDESFLGSNPCIASLSLGGMRDFVMKHKTRKDVSVEKFALRSGDMVVMRGTTQANWLHSIPKRTGKTQSSMPRINVTFRKAINSKGSNNYSHYNVGTGPVHRFVNGEMVQVSV